MTESTHGTIAGSFADHTQAERAVAALEQAGFTHEQVGVLRRGDEGQVTEAHEHAHPAVSAGTGAVEGGLLGAAAAFLIPGAGPVIGAGILGMTALGAITGALTGGVAGALVHAGLGKDDAEHYGHAFEQGHTVVTVRAAGRETEAEQVLAQSGASTRGAGTRV